MIDMHFHTTLSDGLKSNEEIIKQALKNNIKYIVATDHDFINIDFHKLAKKSGIKSTLGAEISAYDFDIKKGLHLTHYIKKQSKEIDEILRNTRSHKMKKSQKQVELLEENGFDINYQEYISYYKKKGVNIENLNIFALANYIYTKPNNLEIIKKITGENLSKDSFIKEFLKKRGKYRNFGWPKVGNFKPDVKIIGKNNLKNKNILSLAHPNFSLTLDEFKDNIKKYLDLGVNAVEINAKASSDWVEIILDYQKKYDYILTFGSDCHFEEVDDYRHGNLGEINPYISSEIIEKNIGKIFT